MKVKYTMKVIKRPDGSIVDLAPVRATAGSSGWDLKAAEAGVVFPNQKRAFGTGISIALEEGWEGQVRSRSGIAKKHSTFVINSPGTIDADYRGEIIVMLMNLGQVPLEVELGDRIAQVVFQEIPPISLELVEQLDETVRGTGGFGSTGI